MSTRQARGRGNQPRAYDRTRAGDPRSSATRSRGPTTERARSTATQHLQRAGRPEPRERHPSGDDRSERAAGDVRRRGAPPTRRPRRARSVCTAFSSSGKLAPISSVGGRIRTAGSSHVEHEEFARQIAAAAEGDAELAGPPRARPSARSCRSTPRATRGCASRPTIASRTVTPSAGVDADRRLHGEKRVRRVARASEQRGAERRAQPEAGQVDATAACRRSNAVDFSMTPSSRNQTISSDKREKTRHRVDQRPDRERHGERARRDRARARLVARGAGGSASLGRPRPRVRRSSERHDTGRREQVHGRADLQAALEAVAPAAAPRSRRTRRPPRRRYCRRTAGR